MDTATIVSGERVLVAADGPAVERGAVLVVGGSVAAVGPAAAIVGANPGAQHVAHPGATILPGLVNAHVHLAFDVTTDPVPALAAGDPAVLRATVEANARDLLARGVTTVRDLGDRDGLVAAFGRDAAAGRAAGPRVLSSSAPLTSPRGHCWFLGGEVSSVAEIRAAVREHADRGADWIKVMAGGGRLTPSARPVWESQFDQQHLDAVVAAAREAGLPVAAHAHGTATMAACAAAGVATIEHGSWQVGPTVEPRCYEQRPEVADAIAASGAAVVATKGRGWPRWPAEQLEPHLERLAWMRRRGIRMLPGTDAGVGRGYFDDLAENLAMLHAAGWTTVETLMMATTWAAVRLGVGDRVGRLAAGYDADVLAVGGDPRADITALRDVRAVWVRGRRVRCANGCAPT